MLGDLEPELMKEILNNKDRTYSKITPDYINKLVGDGLDSSIGPKCSKMRKNHTFHAESLKNMIPAMIVSTEMMLERWKNYDQRRLQIYEKRIILWYFWHDETLEWSSFHCICNTGIFLSYPCSYFLQILVHLYYELQIGEIGALLCYPFSVVYRVPSFIFLFHCISNVKSSVSVAFL
ncbi:uncharacterized protein LOC120005313 [Tripterygium wilfordii]|uniref:uncharacterized protein LOC120005313 n=1 Tax=Tripterygium wilfordii TaxID=458696 RepID=UPI0018F8056D|nr:uncharacterized protein LOC120005313 [Tripterygium wilfordii]XP_038710815.1 uncharacterized protein LOC120005313 [Tripterygium wilfordii]